MTGRGNGPREGTNLTCSTAKQEERLRREFNQESFDVILEEMFRNKLAKGP